MISQDVHVLYAYGGMTLTVINAAHAQGVSERSELTPCITILLVYCMIIKFLGGANQFLGGAKAPLAPLK